MRKTVLMMLYVSVLLFLTCCSRVDETPDISDNGNISHKKAGINFQLPTDDLRLVGSRADIQLPSEMRIERLLAVAFDDVDGGVSGRGNGISMEDDDDPFYTAVPIDLSLATPIGVDLSTLSFGLGKEGPFQICFVANASPELTQTLLDMKPGEGNVATFKSMIVEQAPDAVSDGIDEADGLFMTSAYKELVTSFTDPSYMGLIEMVRAMARIDVENAADGVKITKISFHNRADRTYLFNDSDFHLQLDYVQKIPEVYNLRDFPLVGSSDEPTGYRGKIYSYEQYASDNEPEYLPYLDISYVIPSLSNEREYVHRVWFRRENASGGYNTIPLKRNTLYRIRMHNNEGQISFALGVDDWVSGEEVEVDSGELIDGMKR